MRKDQRYAFKLSMEDKRLLFQLAENEGEQASVILRQLTRREARKLLDEADSLLLKESNISSGINS